MAMTFREGLAVAVKAAFYPVKMIGLGLVIFFAELVEQLKARAWLVAIVVVGCWLFAWVPYSLGKQERLGQLINPQTQKAEAWRLGAQIDYFNPAHMRPVARQLMEDDRIVEVSDPEMLAFLQAYHARYLHYWRVNMALWGCFAIILLGFGVNRYLADKDREEIYRWNQEKEAQKNREIEARNAEFRKQRAADEAKAAAERAEAERVRRLKWEAEARLAAAERERAQMEAEAQRQQELAAARPGKRQRARAIRPEIDDVNAGALGRMARGEIGSDVPLRASAKKTAGRKDRVVQDANAGAVEEGGQSTMPGFGGKGKPGRTEAALLANGYALPAVIDEHGRTLTAEETRELFKEWDKKEIELALKPFKNGGRDRDRDMDLDWDMSM